MEPSRLPAPAFFKLKRLLAERKQYQKQAVLYKQQLHDISVYDTVSSRMRKQEELKNLGRCVRQTEKEIGEIIESDAAIKKNYDLLLSVVGIGLVVAVTTIVLTENFTAFTNGFKPLFLREIDEDFYTKPPKNEEERAERVKNPRKLRTRLMFSDFLMNNRGIIP